MPLYEHVFISRQDLSNTQAEGLIEHFSTVLADNAGKLRGRAAVFHLIGIVVPRVFIAIGDVRIGKAEVFAAQLVPAVIVPTAMIVISFTVV